MENFFRLKRKTFGQINWKVSKNYEIWEKPVKNFKWKVKVYKNEKKSHSEKIILGDT